MGPEDHGYWLDATAYLAILPSLAGDHPPGASEFALDPHRYDFASDRSVHDLWLRSLTLGELRPAPEGVVDEFAMTGGSMLVVARDLEAAWG